jgi:ferrochelatase
MADCLETLEEIDIAARETFIAAGGEAFTTVPCLNNSPALIELLGSRIEIEAAGWIDKD